MSLKKLIEDGLIGSSKDEKRNDKQKYFYVTYVFCDSNTSMGFGSVYIVFDNFKYFSISKVTKYLSEKCENSKTIVVQSWTELCKEQYEEGENYEATRSIK